MGTPARPARSPSPGPPSRPSVEYLSIGHLTVDRLAAGSSIGGSVAYSSRTAARLGMSVAIATSADEEMDWPRLLPGVRIFRRPSRSSTTFENLYRDGHREQRLLAQAEPVPPESIPPEMAGCPIVQVAPVVHEVDLSLISLFPNSLIALAPQGLLREFDGAGRVRQGRWRGRPGELDGVGVVSMSEEDLAGDPGFLAMCVERVPLVLLTRGARGAALIQGSRTTEFPAYPTNEVDPTGAGDVFAASFLVEYHLTGDPLHSTAFACCAASFAVEQPGLEGIPDRPLVERRLEQYRCR